MSFAKKETLQCGVLRNNIANIYLNLKKYIEAIKEY